MRMFSLAATLAVALFAVGPLAHASGGAGAQTVLEQSHAKVIALADADAKPDAIQREVDLLLDYGWIAQAALGGPSRYAERCAPRCDEFEALLTKLIRSSYTKRLSAKQRGEVEYLGEHVRDAATKVDTKVRFTTSAGKTKTVEVDYVMHQVDGRWIVRDIITEKVSLVKTYTHDIHELYQAGGIDRVIEALEAKLAG